MHSPGKLRTVVTSLVLSIALNLSLGVADTIAYSKNSRQFPRLARLFNLLAAPSNAIAEKLAPSGHEGPHFIGAAAIATVSSTLLCALFIWLGLAGWGRARAKSESTTSEGF
jgi:hypothetical protein